MDQRNAVCGGAMFFVLEDFEELRRLLAEILHPYGETWSANCFAEAQAFVERGVPIEAAVLDVALPDGNGLDIGEALQKRGPPVPCLILTGHAEPAISQRALRFGAHFLLKPCDPETAIKSFLIDCREARARRRRWMFAKEARFTHQHWRVLEHAVSGVPSTRIHAQVGVAPGTVRNTIRELLQRADASSLGELVYELHQRFKALERSRGLA